VFDVRSLSDDVREASADTRFALFVLGAFAVLAVTLTTMASMVSSRTPRRAAHARWPCASPSVRTRGESFRCWYAGAMWSLAGLAAGAVGARVLTRYVETLLFHVTPNEVLTFGVVGAPLAIVTLVATILPASRAVHVDPMLALRGD
jgi:putative ABC transport system permease protein